MEEGRRIESIGMEKLCTLIESENVNVNLENDEDFLYRRTALHFAAENDQLDVLKCDWLLQFWLFFFVSFGTLTTMTGSSHGLFACCSHPKNCLCVYFCPCVAFEK